MPAISHSRTGSPGITPLFNALIVQRLALLLIFLLEKQLRDTGLYSVFRRNVYSTADSKMEYKLRTKRKFVRWNLDYPNLCYPNSLLSESSIIRTFHYPSTFPMWKVQFSTRIFVNYQEKRDTISQAIKSIAVIWWHLLGWPLNVWYEKVHGKNRRTTSKRHHAGGSERYYYKCRRNSFCVVAETLFQNSR